MSIRLCSHLGRSTIGGFTVIACIFGLELQGEKFKVHNFSFIQPLASTSKQIACSPFGWWWIPLLFSSSMLWSSNTRYWKSHPPHPIRWKIQVDPQMPYLIVWERNNSTHSQYLPPFVLWTSGLGDYLQSGYLYMASWFSPKLSFSTTVIPTWRFHLDNHRASVNNALCCPCFVPLSEIVQQCTSSHHTCHADAYGPAAV